MLGSKLSSWFISSIANIMTCVQRKARRSNLYRKFDMNNNACLNFANNVTKKKKNPLIISCLNRKHASALTLNN